jgi:hypothetical protein
MKTFLCNYPNILSSFISRSVFEGIKALKYTEYKHERYLQKWQKNKMQGTYLTVCATTIQTIIVYTSFRVSAATYSTVEQPLSGPVLPDSKSPVQETDATHS